MARWVAMFSVTGLHSVYPSVCRTDGYGTDRRLQEHALFRAKNVFRSFKVTNANIETKLEQMCCIHTRLVVCAQEHNDFSGGSP